MKRDWDIIREVLLEVEALSSSDRSHAIYGFGDDHFPGEAIKSAHALLLWKAGYLSGIDASTLGGQAMISPDLTWGGHELLDTLRSKPVWERIKALASEKGLELTLDAVKLLGKSAFEAIINN
jgi:hypothetical protein